MRIWKGARCSLRGISKNSRRIGHPGDHRLGAEALCRLLVGDRDARGHADQHPVGEAGLDVGLENHGGDAVRDSEKHHGTRSVAAHAQCHIDTVAL